MSSKPLSLRDRILSFLGPELFPVTRDGKTMAGTVDALARYTAPLVPILGPVTAQAQIASASASAAAGSAGAAAGSAGAAATTQAQINDKYYGVRSSDPTTRPSGAACQNGDEYQTAGGVRKVFNGGVWAPVAGASATDLAGAGGSSLVGHGSTSVKAILDDVGPRTVRTRKILANRISDATVADVRLVPFEMESQDIINRISGYVGVTDTTGMLLEIAIYDVNFNKLVSSEVREIPAVGDFVFAIPETTLTRGRYYFGICTNSTTAQFGVNPYQGAISATAAFPAPATAAAPTSTAAAPVAAMFGKDLPVPQGLFTYQATNVRVYGLDVTGGNQPWGLDTTTFKIVKSVDGGNTWQQMMSQPPIAAQEGSTMLELIIASDGRLYLFTNICTLWRTNNLTASATWENVSCPIAPGLRHAQAVGRGYGIREFNGYLFFGEYSNAPNEFAPDGPRILRYKLSDGTWALSKEFTNARHIHSFYTPGSSVLWVSIGDAGFGTDVGIHRIVLAGIGAGAGGTDSWVKWTKITAPQTDHYPVDFIQRGSPATYNGRTAPAGLYCTSDRPGRHVLYSKTSGVAGQFNLSAQIFQRAGGPAGETVRCLCFDASNNLYYWTAETTEPGIYCSPPPYTQAVKLKDLTGVPGVVLMQAFCVGNYIFMFNQKIHIEKFVGQ